MEEKELDEQNVETAETKEEPTPETEKSGESADTAAEAEQKTEASASEESKESDDKKDKKKSFLGKDKKEKANKLQEKVEELEDKVKRQMAEFDNFRKRSEKEKSAMFETGAKSVVEKILPVVDNFERGLAGLSEEEMKQPFAEGMNMVYKQLITELEKLDVKPIEAVGCEFNPELHNAVMHIEDEQYGQSVVIDEYEKGFKLGDKVIRFSVVRVAN